MNISTVSMITFSAKKNRFLNQQPKNYECCVEGIKIYPLKFDKDRSIKEQNAYVLLAFTDISNSNINKFLDKHMIRERKCVGCIDEKIDRNTFYAMQPEEKQQFIDTKIRDLKNTSLLLSKGAQSDMTGNIGINKQ